MHLFCRYIESMWREAAWGGHCVTPRYHCVKTLHYYYNQMIYSFHLIAPWIPRPLSAVLVLVLQKSLFCICKNYVTLGPSQRTQTANQTPLLCLLFLSMRADFEVVPSSSQKQRKIVSN